MWACSSHPLHYFTPILFPNGFGSLYMLFQRKERKKNSGSCRKSIYTGWGFSRIGVVGEDCEILTSLERSLFPPTTYIFVYRSDTGAVVWREVQLSNIQFQLGCTNRRFLFHYFSFKQTRPKWFRLGMPAISLPIGQQMNRGGQTIASYFLFRLFFEGQIELVDLVDLNRLMIVVGWDLL